MSLSDQSAVNCTLSVPRIGFRCCLAASGTWLGGHTCAFREDPHQGVGENLMAKRLGEWNKCLAAAATGNDTLTDILASSGQVCSAAPGSYTATQQGFFIVGSVLAGFGVLGLLVCIIAVCCNGANERAQRRAAAARAASGDDVEMESTPLFAEDDSEDGADKDKRQSEETFVDGKR
ncbi:hypothetical protein Q8F55_005429 [Vanrija albida]|uniref:Transmembrane protein n=1 Tax=Vanrija albida TaxID=181172 RepID=A0ABR3Q2D2_9TREE